MGAAQDMKLVTPSGHLQQSRPIDIAQVIQPAHWYRRLVRGTRIEHDPELPPGLQGRSPTRGNITEPFAQTADQALKLVVGHVPK
jgi:hypothetical protein